MSHGGIDFLIRQREGVSGCANGRNKKAQKPAATTRNKLLQDKMTLWGAINRLCGNINTYTYHTHCEDFMRSRRGKHTRERTYNYYISIEAPNQPPTDLRLIQCYSKVAMSNNIVIQLASVIFFFFIIVCNFVIYIIRLLLILNKKKINSRWYIQTQSISRKFVNCIHLLRHYTGKTNLFNQWGPSRPRQQRSA